jgi:hypothetical protein
MKLLHKLKIILSNFLFSQDTPWWVEITTGKPICIYYFGPFDNLKAAEISYLGYVEDLESEAAQEIVVNIKRCQPQILTIFSEEEL